jgi:magnesium transporter
MRIFHIHHNQVTETSALDALQADGTPSQGFIWVACGRREFEVMQSHLQSMLLSVCGVQLVDLHVTDLLNNQLPSHYDYTSQYDILVFRRLAAGTQETETIPSRAGPPILRRIDTSPVGFAVFDKLVLTVHPTDCAVRDAYANKLLLAAHSESKSTTARLPTSPADLMLRVVNQMVDGYLALRRELTHQLDHWQSDLLNPNSRFDNWSALLDARLALHQLDEICEEQRSCIQDWIEAVKAWPDASTPAEARDRELLQVRSRDVLEHIERVVHHVRRLEQSAETAVQIHFSAQTHRANDTMRTLTTLTAIFLPLNLIAGIFGMNFEFMPLLRWIDGFWWTMGSMVLIAVSLALVFWRRQYLALSRN